MNEGLGSKKFFSENLKRMLNERGLTMRDLQRELDIPYPTIVKWSQQVSYPSVKNIDRLAEFFGCYRSDLVEGRGNSRRELEDRLFSGRTALREVYQEAKYLSENDLRLAARIIRTIRHDAELRKKEEAHGKDVLSERKEVQLHKERDTIL